MSRTEIAYLYKSISLLCVQAWPQMHFFLGSEMFFLMAGQCTFLFKRLNIRNYTQYLQYIYIYVHAK